MRAYVEVPDFPTAMPERKRRQLIRRGQTARTELSQNLAGMAMIWGDDHALRGYARLSTILDELIASEVRYERADGASWAQIGEALGISKQAAQQRFM